ncbi:MAG: TniQ family protein [Maritimibacter sp.]
MIASDMGTSFKHFVEQEPQAFEALAAWADLDEQQMEEMLSWSGVRAGIVRMTFRGEVFVSRALRNPVMRGCPVCLREDVAQQNGPEASAMVMRGDWQLRELNICVKHHHPLVPLWAAGAPHVRFDIGSRLREIEGDILSGRLDQPETQPSAYDLWLDGRVRDGRDETWFKGMPLFAATTFCRLLGQSVLSCSNSAQLGIVSPAHAAGFNIARNGEVAVRDALDRVAKASIGHLDTPNKAFGLLYPNLSRAYADEDGFPVFARILRECILENWPIAPGDMLLGEVVRERRLHSLVTAAKETGIGAQVIEHFLVEAGALSELDDRPRSRRVFDAQLYGDLLSEIPKLVGRLAMCKAMGATNRELKALESEGVLIPRTRVAKVIKPWRISDGIDFVANLSEKAVLVSKDTDNWEILLHARKRTKLSLSEQVAAIRDEQLAVGRLTGVSGFHGLVVRKNEIDQLKAQKSKRLGPDEIELSGSLSAAEFGRSVGLRAHGYFVSLIEAGHTPAERRLNPRTGRQQYRLSKQDIAAFHRCFVTLTTLSNETGLHRNTLRRMFERSRVTGFAPDGHDFGPVYLRSEAAKALLR